VSLAIAVQIRTRLSANTQPTSHHWAPTRRTPQFCSPIGLREFGKNMGMKSRIAKLVKNQ
jgi:hypothetical protein